MLEIARGGIAVGPCIGAEVAVTEYMQLGAYASNERGTTFPHLIPPLWFVPYLEGNKVFITHEGKYSTWSFGRKGEESSQDAQIRFHRARHDIRAQAAFGLVHAYVNLDSNETIDFACGLLAIDPQNDDVSESPGQVREPGRQFARGIINVITGPMEIPFNIHLVNQEDGGLYAVTYGLTRGVWRFAVREGVGAMEIVTFPFGWQSVIEPRFPFEPHRSTDWFIREPEFRDID
jgi:putative exosortase-associated protein (TIGR04073 family)